MRKDEESGFGAVMDGWLCHICLRSVRWRFLVRMWWVSTEVYVFGSYLQLKVSSPRNRSAGQHWVEKSLNFGSDNGMCQGYKLFR